MGPSASGLSRSPRPERIERIWLSTIARDGEAVLRHPVADAASIDAVSDLPDRPGAQIPDDMGNSGQVPYRAREQISSMLIAPASTTTHPGGARRIGHLLVVKHLGTAVLIDHSRFHARVSNHAR
jgi:hypothetical protein